MNEVIEVRVIDAYRTPQRTRPGCQHQLGCKCDPPYWLRASSTAEETHEARIRGEYPGQQRSEKP